MEENHIDNPNGTWQPVWPYGSQFLFADHIQFVSNKQIVGRYTFPKDAWYYEDHFKKFPVTPGVLLTECCAQIGLVALGMWLVEKEGGTTDNSFPVLTASRMNFREVVLPGTLVTVKSRLVYFRFGKLKCSVQMTGPEEVLVCEGELEGMIIKRNEDV